MPDREEIGPVLEAFARAARTYLEGLDDRPVLSPRVDAAARSFEGRLPETGVGALAAFERLVERGLDASAATSGPRCYHFVIGGVTPAALAADLWATVLDQPAYAWASSPLGVKLEQVACAWLLDLFELPASWTGVMTTGATMANFVGLAAARQWWAERHGVDVAEEGASALPPMPVLTSGHVHASSVKCLSLLGVGRASVRRLAGDDTGRLDVAALDRALAGLDGAPAVLIANAGEVNAGDFDPIDRMAELAERHRAWLHVDGAFGLFARLSPRTRHLVAGMERADSITVDGHKWLNVPYDCGYAFVRDGALLPRAFAYSADYLVQPDDPRPNYGVLAAESSRRARGLATWATLAAYGRSGTRWLVERCLDLARHLKERVDAEPELERLAEVPLNIVCFRFNPGGLLEDALDALNTRLGEALLRDGRVFAGTTRYRGRVALRPAIVNWRTRPEHLDELVEVVLEIGRACRTSA